MAEPGLRIAPDLVLPLEAVTQTFGILAKRGVGKTYTALVLVEEMLKAGLQVVVADPVGVCWGLRASADGDGPGLPIVILGGDHADVPLEHDAGEVIADLVVDERLSVVLDLSRFRKGQQTRFMQDFCERLYHRNREPLHLVLDEADAFAPQRPMKGQERMLGAVEDLIRRGRARGIGVTLVTQRAAVLNKDVLTQVEVLVPLRTIAPQDRDAIDAWVRVHGTPEQREELMGSLPSLPVGTAWVWSPGWLGIFRRVQVRQRETYDSSATPTAGARPVAPRILAPVDLQRTEARIAATIERAKLEDPKRLRARVAELERELAAARAARPSPERVMERVDVPVEVPVEVPVIDPDLAGRLVDAAAALDAAAERAASAARELSASITRAWEATRRTPGPGPAPSALPRLLPGPRPPEPAVPRPRAADANGPVLRAGERKILATLAARYPARYTKAQLGTLSGFTPSGGTFRTYLGTLKRHGLAIEEGTDVFITRAGLDFIGAELPAPLSTAELRDLWRRALRAGERKMLDVCIEAYPQALSLDELAVASGFERTGGTFRTYLGTLKRNGLVDVTDGGVRAAEVLFL